jgi:pSer/pThr/pTyr-binding forkhead associated (FHA) protein
MSDGTLVLVGVSGLVEGEIFQIKKGEEIVVGRSRSCDISLRKCFKYLSLDPDERNRNKHFQTVSRKHLKIVFVSPAHIEIENMGANGTFIDGTKVDRVIITDIRDQSHEMILGTKEKFRLEWRDEDDFQQISRTWEDQGEPAGKEPVAETEKRTRRVEAGRPIDDPPAGEEAEKPAEESAKEPVEESAEESADEPQETS